MSIEKNNKALPEKWITCKLKDIGEIIAGGTPSTNEPSFWGDEISWITPADLSGYKSMFISKGRKSISIKGLQSSSARLIPKGSVLFSSRAPIGYIVIASNELATNQGFKNIVLYSGIDSKYLYYYLMANKQLAEENASGTTFKEISATKFAELPLVLAPSNEQVRISDKLDELLSELEKGKEQLQTSLEQLKVYRQSILKYAFEGKLTNTSVNNEELPSGWKIKTVKQISNVLGDGLHGTPKYSEDGDYFFINGNNLSDGVIEIKNNTKRVSKTEFEKYKKPLNDKTILVSINGSIGYTAFYNNEQVVLGKSACYFNVVEGINKKYVRYFLKSNAFTSYANENATGSTIKNLGLKAMRDFPIPFPPNESEQDRIVELIESQFSIYQNVEETIQSNIREADVLKQSLLEKAFKGKLVEQDPADEPATVLLKRIKKQREEFLNAEKERKKTSKK